MGSCCSEGPLVQCDNAHPIQINGLFIQAQLRLTAQRLGQLQERKDSLGQSTRMEIADLLRQGNVRLARAKAQNLLHENTVADLLEALEMHVGLLVEHFAEIEQKYVLEQNHFDDNGLTQTSENPSPTISEAASSIIFAAPHTESRGMLFIRTRTGERYSPVTRPQHRSRITYATSGS
jgi:hypothetical protein